MKAGACCKKTAGGVLPGLLLVLVPKCPVCMALYVSAATGIGIPFVTAKYLRIGLIAGCVGALALFVWRRWKDWRGHDAGKSDRGDGQGKRAKFILWKNF